MKKKNFKLFFQRLPGFLAERAFLTFLAFFLAVLIASGLIFYQYSVLAKRAEIGADESPAAGFDEKSYQEVLKFWQDKEIRLEETDSREYPDPFD